MYYKIIVKVNTTKFWQFLLKISEFFEKKFSRPSKVVAQTIYIFFYVRRKLTAKRLSTSQFTLRIIDKLIPFVYNDNLIHVQKSHKQRCFYQYDSEKSLP